VSRAKNKERKNTMKKMNIHREGFVRQYANEGQHLQQLFDYAMTGKVAKADNLPYWKGADVLHYQVKSARATICKGTDLESHLAQDKALEYVYVSKQEIAYIMSRQEYKEFVNLFATKDVESSKNGKSIKLRLGRETSKLMAWLEGRA
jgi:hypothetical protein